MDDFNESQQNSREALSGINQTINAVKNILKSIGKILSTFLKWIGGILGAIATVFIVAYATMKDKKEAIGFDRYMPDSEITRRLLGYAKPYALQFVFIGILMLISIGYDVVSPLLIGGIEEMLRTDFEMPKLLAGVLIYGSTLVISLACSYAQTIMLQKTGQKIISSLRQDIFAHIETHLFINGQTL